MSNNTDYQTSTFFSEFVACVGWVSFLTAIGAGFYIYEQAGKFGLIAVPVCFAVSLIGFLLVVAGQSLRAQLDTANATKQMLEVMKDRK